MPRKQNVTIRNNRKRPGRVARLTKRLATTLKDRRERLKALESAGETSGKRHTKLKHAIISNEASLKKSQGISTGVRQAARKKQ